MSSYDIEGLMVDTETLNNKKRKAVQYIAVVMVCFILSIAMVGYLMKIDYLQKEPNHHHHPGIIEFNKTLEVEKEQFRIRKEEYKNQFDSFHNNILNKN